jgi:hypothetical protein
MHAAAPPCTAALAWIQAAWQGNKKVASQRRQVTPLAPAAPCCPEARCNYLRRWQLLRTLQLERGNSHHLLRQLAGKSAAATLLGQAAAAAVQPPAGGGGQQQLPRCGLRASGAQARGSCTARRPRLLYVAPTRQSELTPRGTSQSHMYIAAASIGRRAAPRYLNPVPPAAKHYLNDETVGACIGTRAQAAPA